MAAEFDAMAASASTQEAKQALERLAARFRVSVAGRGAASPPNGPVKPGMSGPPAGVLDVRSIFGTWTGDIVRVRQGELLPRAPREFSWHLTTPPATPP